ncbi:hypothetical protein GP2_003_01460 [Gordonia paraffinivorans NBRC 108238]|uniref:Transposase n=1 Tax=Gordonia paraffinivorans NBRC 108238 TaxID=1223543 RepID=A0ABQ0IH42_9ACTN|nr:hypothetical protein GP2_003_01460 [Gordonia paraffinivorans NBRC 108238]
MGTMARYTNEMRERAVRMVAEVRPEHRHETAALRHVGGLLGMNVETLRLWVHRAQVDAGVRPGTTSRGQRAPAASRGRGSLHFTGCRVVPGKRRLGFAQAIRATV